jgi:rhodanese-related sulfurtransferase
MPQTIDQMLETARSRLDRLDPIAARDAAASGAVIVDTRCAEARQASGVIPGSVHVPLSVLYWRLDHTSGHADETLAHRDRQFILVCADGYSSSLAAATLRDLGFSRATDLAGGFNGWKAAGLPVEPSPHTTPASPIKGRSRPTGRGAGR